MDSLLDSSFSEGDLLLLPILYLVSDLAYLFLGESSSKYLSSSLKKFSNDADLRIVRQFFFNFKIFNWKSSRVLYTRNYYLFLCYSMIHFFLHWGRTWIDSEKNKKFFQTLCSYGNKILIFPFGWTIENHDFDKYKEWFLRYNPDKTLTIICADYDIPILIQQVSDSDIIFLGWWSVRKHLEILDKIPNLKNLLDNKIVAWVSAWSIVRGKAYYSSIKDSLGDWIGLLPIKTLAHYWDNNPGLPNEERIKILNEYWEKLPIYKIPEQEFIEFDI